MSKNNQEKEVIKEAIKLCSKNKPTKFIKKRKYSPEIIKKLRIGYFKQDTYEKLMRKYGRDAVKEAGILKKNHCLPLDKVIIPNEDDKYFSFKPAKFSLAGRQRKPYILTGTAPTIITEGETDAIALKHIYPKNKIIGLRGVKNQKILKKLNDEIWICFDNDKAGENGRENAINKLHNAEKIIILKIPKKYKDIDELWRKKQKESKKYLETKKVNITKKRKQKKKKTQGHEKNTKYVTEFKKYIKSKYKEKYGKTISVKEGKKIHCINPNHEDKHSSMKIYKNSAYCFGCGLKIKENQIEKNTITIEKSPTKEYFGIKNFNKSTSIFIEKKELYQHEEQIIRNNNTYYKIKYTLYVGQIGKGNRPKILKTKYKINKGDNNIYLKPLSDQKIRETLYEMTSWGFSGLCKRLNINLQGQDKEEIVQDIINLKQVFYEPTIPIDKQEIRKIGNPLETIKKILKVGITQIDKDLIDFYITDIPEIEPSKIKPDSYMSFSNNKIVITNSGTGKTTISKSITNEPSVEKPTGAALLGFATAKDKREGMLHGRTKPTYLEEVQEELENENFRKLHTYMEQGNMKIQRGIGVECVGYSSLTFQGNPKDKNIDKGIKKFILIKQFTDFLAKISNNTEPFSRRISLLIFDKKLKELEGTGIKETKKEKGNQIIRTIAEGYRKEFTDLFFNKEISKWLNSSFKEDYINLIKGIINDTSDRKIKEFLKGAINSYRHSRGMALRYAWLDVGLNMLWDNNKIDVQSLLESADNFLERIKRRNIESYKNVISMLNSETYQKINEYHLKNIKPKYLKLAVYTLFEWIINNPENQDKIVPLTEIEDNYSEVKKFLEIKLKDKYRSFYTIKKSFKEYKINFSIIEDLGLDYDNLNQSFMLIRLNKIKKYVKLYKVTKVTSVTGNNKSVTDVTCNRDFLQKNKNNSDLNVVEEDSEGNLISKTDKLKDTINDGYNRHDELIKKGFSEDLIAKAKEEGEIMKTKGNKYEVV